MPYSLNELGEIVSDSAGVSWADAVKQQRARSANAARVASMYQELDAMEIEPLPEPKTLSPLEEKTGELVKIVVGNEQDRALTASVVQAIDGISNRLHTNEQIQESLVAAIAQMAEQKPNINVEAPNVTVEPPAITVEQPAINFQPPDIHITAPEINPVIEVHPQLVMPVQPQTKKTIVFDRDYDGRLNKAEVIEGGEQPSQTT